MYEFRLFGIPTGLLVARFRGRTRVFDGLPRPVGPPSSALIWMDDKDTMKEKFMRAGIPVARGGSSFTKRGALEIFHSIRKPAVVKPHTGSRSRHTTTHVGTEAGLERAFSVAKQLSPWVVIEEELVGDVFRGTVIGGRVAGVARRDPPRVTGDGKRRVLELVREENKSPLRRGPIFHEIAITEEVAWELKRQGLTPESVPERGQVVSLNQKVNRGVGGTVAEVTGTVHLGNIRLLERVSEVLGDPLVGVDFIVKDISRPWTSEERCGVIECNSLPFLDLHHYPFVGVPRNAAGALWDIIFPDSSRSGSETLQGRTTRSTTQSPSISKNSSRRSSIPTSSK